MLPKHITVDMSNIRFGTDLVCLLLLCGNSKKIWCQFNNDTNNLNELHTRKDNWLPD